MTEVEKSLATWGQVQTCDDCTHSAKDRVVLVKKVNSLLYM